MSHNPVLDSLAQLMILSCRAEGITCKCKGRGALLSLPNGGCSNDVIRTKAFEDYIRDNVVRWFTWAQNNKLGVGKLEDLILVSGCTLVTSWAAATFVDDTSSSDAKISLASKPLNNGGPNFVWSNKQGSVMFHNSQFDPVRSPVYVYSTCTDFFLAVSKEKSTHDSGSMCLHQGLQSKAQIVPDQTPPCRCRTPSRRP